VLTANPQLQLETLFCLNSRGRIISTREPQPSPSPSFMLIRGASTCAWAVAADVDDERASALAALAAQEHPSTAWDQPPRYAQRYQDLLPRGAVRWGPAFAFPQHVEATGDSFLDVVAVDDEALLESHFSGWVAGEIAAGRGPVMAVSEGERAGGHAVSICFCARRWTEAAEAGVETAAAFRGRGYAPRVTAAWANAVRSIGLTPIYSTDWSNRASLAVARKLQLIPFAIDWSLSGERGELMQRHGRLVRSATSFGVPQLRTTFENRALLFSRPPAATCSKPRKPAGLPHPSQHRSPRRRGAAQAG